MCSSFGHHGQLQLSGAMVVRGRPRGSLSHVANHSVSEVGRWRCLWKTSVQLICPTLGIMSRLGSAGAVARRMSHSTGRGGLVAIVFGCFFSIFLQADKQLRQGSRCLFVLRFCMIARAMLVMVD